MTIPEVEEAGVSAGRASDATLRRGDWMQTYTGRQFWPVDPRPEDVDIRDIAHALSMLCRFGGHCLRFYSVAEHCVLLSYAVEPKDALWALLHDASEAYLVDVPRPVKGDLIGYREIEAQCMSAICLAFDLDDRMPPAVKDADNRILADEARQIMAPAPVPWNDTGKPLGVLLTGYTPPLAERLFLNRFTELLALRTQESSNDQ